jgi:aminoglycoside phosphotransferase (APT) family kinase protein
VTHPVEPPGRPLASGRAADVYDLEDGTVLRRYRSGGHDVEYEARVMRYVRERGIPVPGVVAVEDGRDLVMERLDGPTMLDDLVEHPAKVLFHARTLARLQRGLAEVAAPTWMLAPGVEPGHDSVLHLDLHPGNVMLTGAGPVIIDWTNAAGGPPGFDAALSVVGMSSFEVDDPRQRAWKQAFVTLFRRFRGGRRVVEPYLVAACDHRLADANLTPGERVAVAALRKEASGRRGGGRGATA